jgi:hypothetical protein
LPYKSQAQEKYFNANRAKLEKEGVDVDEWNHASKGAKLPEKAHMSKNLTHGLGTKPKAYPKAKDKRKHGIHSTTIEHLADGSHVCKMCGPGVPDGHSFSAPDTASLTAGLQKHLCCEKHPCCEKHLCCE